jgi:hypothetical protein
VFGLFPALLSPFFIFLFVLRQKGKGGSFVSGVVMWMGLGPKIEEAEGSGNRDLFLVVPFHVYYLIIYFCHPTFFK